MGAALYDYCLVPPECLARYYRYTGDLRALEDNIDAVRRIVAAFRDLKGDEGLLLQSNLPDIGNDFRKGFLFLDHPGNGWHPQTTTGHDRRDTNAGLNLFYLQAIQAMIEVESALGHDAGALEREATDLAQALRARCLIEEQGLIADAAGPAIETPRFSQIVNAMAVTTGLLEGPAARYALERVMDIPRHPWISQGTPYSAFFLAEASARCGFGDAALRMFTRDFGLMLESGATTTWEAWRAENHDSLNHAWSAPMPHLVRRALMGLTPTQPGYSALQLQPDLSALDSFSATCLIPQGAVQVAWQRSTPTAFHLSVSIPEGIAGLLQLGNRVVSLDGPWQGEVL